MAVVGFVMIAHSEYNHIANDGILSADSSSSSKIEGFNNLGLIHYLVLSVVSGFFYIKNARYISYKMNI